MDFSDGCSATFGMVPCIFLFFFFFLRIFREDSSGILLIERLRRLRAKRRIRQWNTSDKQTSSAVLCWRVVSAWPRVQRSIGDQWKWGRMECCYQPLSGISSVICDPLSPLCSFHCKFQRAETNGESNIHSTLRHWIDDDHQVSQQSLKTSPSSPNQTSHDQSYNHRVHEVVTDVQWMETAGHIHRWPPVQLTLIQLIGPRSSHHSNSPVIGILMLLSDRQSQRHEWNTMKRSSQSASARKAFE